MKWQEEIMIERKAKVAVNEWITHGNDAFLLTGSKTDRKNVSNKAMSERKRISIYRIKFYRAA